MRLVWKTRGELSGKLQSRSLCVCVFNTVASTSYIVFCLCAACVYDSWRGIGIILVLVFLFLVWIIPRKIPRNIFCVNLLPVNRVKHWLHLQASKSWIILRSFVEIQIIKKIKKRFHEEQEGGAGLSIVYCLISLLTMSYSWPSADSGSSWQPKNKKEANQCHMFPTWPNSRCDFYLHI